MKDMIDTTGPEDDIDHLVEMLLKDPARADAIKSMFRERMAVSDSETVVALHPGTSALDAEADEFWENFPV